MDHQTIHCIRGAFPPLPPRLILFTISRANTPTTSPIDHATSAALHNYIYLLFRSPFTFVALTAGQVYRCCYIRLRYSLTSLQVPFSRLVSNLKYSWLDSGLICKLQKNWSCEAVSDLDNPTQTELEAYKLTYQTHHIFKSRFSQQYSNDFRGRGRGSQAILKLSRSISHFSILPFSYFTFIFVCRHISMKIVRTFRACHLCGSTFK